MKSLRVQVLAVWKYDSENMKINTILQVDLFFFLHFGRPPNATVSNRDIRRARDAVFIFQPVIEKIARECPKAIQKSAEKYPFRVTHFTRVDRFLFFCSVFFHPLLFSLHAVVIEIVS